MSLIKWADTPELTSIVGKVVSLKTKDNQFGPCLYLSILCPDDRITTMACPSALRALIDQEGVRPGDNVRLTYIGPRKSRINGRTFHAFSLRIQEQPTKTRGSKVESVSHIKNGV